MHQYLLVLMGECHSCIGTERAKSSELFSQGQIIKKSSKQIVIARPTLLKRQMSEEASSPQRKRRKQQGEVDPMTSSNHEPSSEKQYKMPWEVKRSKSEEKREAKMYEAEQKEESIKLFFKDKESSEVSSLQRALRNHSRLLCLENIQKNRLKSRISNMSSLDSSTRAKTQKFIEDISQFLGSISSRQRQSIIELLSEQVIQTDYLEIELEEKNRLIRDLQQEARQLKLKEERLADSLQEKSKILELVKKEKDNLYNFLKATDNSEVCSEIIKLQEIKETDHLKVLKLQQKPHSSQSFFLNQQNKQKGVGKEIKNQSSIRSDTSKLKQKYLGIIGELKAEIKKKEKDFNQLAEKNKDLELAVKLLKIEINRFST